MSNAMWPGMTLALSLAAGAAFAQDATPPDGEGDAELLPTIPVETRAAPTPPPLSEAASPTRLEEIVVTATKREANARDLPASVSALHGDDLERLGVQSQEDFLKQIPGVTFANDSITPNRITIRGIGADLNTSNTTGVFIGDVPFEDPTLPRVTLDPNPFDLARIEVLKGPQGTLFGGSALNGAVRYVPTEPMLGQWQAKAFTQLENVYEGDAGLIYGAAVNVPAGDTLAFRAVGFDRDSPGWVDDLQRGIDDVNEVSQQGGRLMALWQPDEAWKISAMVIAQKTDVADIPITDNEERRLSRSNTPQQSPTRSRYDLETIGIGYAFDSFDVLSQTSRTYKFFDGLIDASRIGNLDRPPPTVTLTNTNESEGLMQEIRFSSNAGFDPRWNWLAGAFYRKVHMTEVSDILASNLALPIPDPLLELLNNIIPGFYGFITEDGKINAARGEADPIDVSEAALFGEASIGFWEDFELTLGLRLFQTRSHSRILFSGAATITPQNFEGSTLAVKEGDLREQGVNPKIALKYEINDNASVYGSVARGFRFGGAQVLVGTITSQAPDFYKSDIIWSYELGLRSQWLDRTLTADVTAFQIDWIDPQLQQADATGLGSYFDNVGGARGRGVETALRYVTPLPGLSLSVAASYVKTVTTEPFTTSNGEQTQPGTTWPLAARWQTASTLSYQRPLFGSWEGGASLLYSTISSAPNTLSYLDTVFGYQTLDATLNIANYAIDGKPELSLVLANATDERGIISGVNNPQFAKDHNYIRPRTLIARVAVSF
ncbi:MAG TPA: TonB-dependent receptor [Fontimonas sp.]